MDHGLVSIVIPAKDAAHLIERCLGSIARQTYRPIEVIVVDNGSNDATAQIAAQHGAQVLCAGGRTPTARNEGARAARGVFLLNLDADMELDPASVAQCVDAVVDGADVAILPERNVARGFWMQAFSFGKELVRGAPGFEYGRFMLKPWFDRVGGYDENLLSGEDRDIFLRLLAAGARPANIRALTLHHVEHLTISAVLRKTAAYTRTRDAFIHKHPRAAAGDRASLLGLVRKRWRLLAASPLRAGGWLALTAFLVVRDAFLLRRVRHIASLTHRLEMSR